MSEEERVHFKIALPVGLKKRLEHQAVESRRSLSAEIISRLEQSLVTKEAEAASSLNLEERVKSLTPDQAEMLDKIISAITSA